MTPLLVGQNNGQWIICYMVQGDGGSNVVLSMVTMLQFIMPFIRSFVLLWRDTPRVQTITMTNYICLHVYWFAVVFCLLILQASYRWMRILILILTRILILQGVMSVALRQGGLKYQFIPCLVCTKMVNNSGICSGYCCNYCWSDFCCTGT